jgi:hypothetical protein
MCNVLQIVVCPFVLFLLVIVLSVLPLNYGFLLPFGFVKLFLLWFRVTHLSENISNFNPLMKKGKQ